MKLKILFTVFCLATAAMVAGIGIPAHAETTVSSVEGKAAVTVDTSKNFSVAQYVQGGIGTDRRPRNSEVPLPGSGRRIPVSARDAAAENWDGCRNWTNRFKEPFQRCCRINPRGLRSCYDQY